MYLKWFNFEPWGFSQNMCKYFRRGTWKHVYKYHNDKDYELFRAAQPSLNQSLFWEISIEFLLHTSASGAENEYPIQNWCFQVFHCSIKISFSYEEQLFSCTVLISWSMASKALWKCHKSQNFIYLLDTWKSRVRKFETHKNFKVLIRP